MTVKTFRQQDRLFGIFNRKPKITHMAGDRFLDSMAEDGSDLASCDITLEHIFENRALLAHNHWVGVYRITYEDGDYDQFVVHAGATAETAQRKIQYAVLADLEQYCISIDPSVNRLGLSITQEDYPITIHTREIKT